MLKKNVCNFLRGLGQLILILGGKVVIVILGLLALILVSGFWHVISEILGFIGGILNNSWVVGGLILIWLFCMIFTMISDRKNEGS